MAEQGQRARDCELVKKFTQEEREKKLEIERTIKKIKICQHYHQSFHCDEENKEVLNEKVVQTEEVENSEVGTQLEDNSNEMKDYLINTSLPITQSW